MAIDASIYNNIKPVQIESPLASLARITNLEGQQKQNRLSDLMLGEKERALSSENAQRDITKSSFDAATGKINPEKMRSGLAGIGDYKGLQTFETNQAAQIKTQRESEKFKIEGVLKQFEVVGQIMGGVKDQASYDVARQQISQILGPEAAAQQPAAYDPAAIEAGRAKAMSVKEQLEQKWKAMEYTTPNANARLTAETSRANNASSNATTRRGQDLTDSRSREANALPKGQVVQTDQGTMLVDPRTGTAQPVTANGQALQPKLKDLPAPISKALMENNVSLRKIDDALAAIETYPDALGMKNYLGDEFRQRSDPQGVNARALVADIGSLKIHDRSGAAVTAAETPRLKPFIPTSTDNPETVKKKLGLFKREYEAIQDDIHSTYTREQGFKAPAPVAKKAPPSNGAFDAGKEARYQAWKKANGK